MKKKLIYILLAASLITGYFYFKNGPSSKKPVVITQEIKASLKLPKNADFVNFTLINGETALELLQSKAKVITKGQGVNAYVTAIDGRVANDSKKEYWAFYVNGKLSNVGAGSYKLKSEDKIEWKIENY